MRKAVDITQSYSKGQNQLQVLVEYKDYHENVELQTLQELEKRSKMHIDQINRQIEKHFDFDQTTKDLLAEYKKSKTGENIQKFSFGKLGKGGEYGEFLSQLVSYFEKLKIFCFYFAINNNKRQKVGDLKELKEFEF